MTWVKICGMTNLEDALCAVDAGADAVGFVFYEKSPRCVTVEKVREICEKLPEGVERIGVVVDAVTDPINVLFEAGLTGTQNYVTREGIAGSAFGSGQKAIGLAALPARYRFLLALPMGLFEDPVGQIESMVEGFARSKQQMPAHASIPEGILDTFLLDSGGAGLPGGSGKTFDWEKTGPIGEVMRQHGMKFVVAGGLRPDNVSAAIEILHPWGVDVVSGVEASPGKKDPEKVRAFVRAVREYDRKAG